MVEKALSDVLLLLNILRVREDREIVLKHQETAANEFIGEMNGRFFALAKVWRCFRVIRPHSYVSEKAILLGVVSRPSSGVFKLRDVVSLLHVNH